MIALLISFPTVQNTSSQQCNVPEMELIFGNVDDEETVRCSVASYVIIFLNGGQGNNNF